MTTRVAGGTINGIDTDALQQTMETVAQNPATGIARFQVTTRWGGDGPRSESRVESWMLGGRTYPKNFTIPIDEPPELLGRNTAPNPQEVLLAAVNACLLATYVAACAAQGITLRSLEIETRGTLDLRGFLGIDKRVKPGYDALQYTVRIAASATRPQLEAVHKWVAATSPNYWNMANPIRMEPELVIE